MSKRILLSLVSVALFGVNGTVAQQINTNMLPLSDVTTGPAYQIGAERVVTPTPETIEENGVVYDSVFSGDGAVELDGSACGSCDVGPCCAVCGGGSNCPPVFYVDQGVRVLTRSRARDQALSLEFIGGLGFVERMRVATMNFDIAAGYAITIGSYRGRDSENRDHFLEFTYFGLNDWSENYAVNFEDGALWTQFPASVGGFNDTDQHRQTARSSLNNFELNLRIVPRGRPDRLVLHPSGRWRRECQEGCFMSYLFGFRSIVINERFNFHANGLGFNAPDDSFGDYDIRTNNNLFGLQVGTEMTFRHCKWNWGIRGKIGPFVNFSDQKTLIGVFDSRYPQNFQISRFGDKDEASLVAECGFVGFYKIRPNLTLRAAYDFMWVTGLALGPDQLDFDINAPTGWINDNGNVYYHGLSLTAELVW